MSSQDKRATHILDGRDKFVEDILQLLKKGSSIDVRITLEDGEILANKDVLSTRCEYFATMFSNNEVKFIEGVTNSVDMSHCSKVIMEKIINYLFSGKMKLNDFKLEQLLKLMNMASLMLLDELFVNVEDYIMGWLPDSGVNYGWIPDLVSGLMLAEKFKLDAVKDDLLFELFLSLKDVPHIPDVVETYDNFKDLPLSLVKEILLLDKVGAGGVSPTTKERFDAFVYWLSENESECNIQDKRDVIQSFNFDDFTGKELVTDVRRSGFYSVVKIDKRVMELLNSRETIIRENESIKSELKEKDKVIAEQKTKIDWIVKMVNNYNGNKMDGLGKMVNNYFGRRS